MKKLFSVNPFGLGIWSLIIFIGIINENCSGQNNNFKYKPVPNEYLPTESELAPYRVQSDNAKIGAYDLTNSLPPNFVRDGSVDYTSYLQKGIKSNPKVIFPDFPVLVKGLAIMSNSTLIFGKNSKVIMVPNSTGSYTVFSIFNVRNVKIFFPVIQGEVSKHMGTKGEYGMGILIDGSSNIQIFNPKVSDCWGDGIYIGKSTQISKNIRIYYPVLDNNRRNGISIVSVDSLTVINAVISNTNGTAPMAGIDFEPNSNEDTINNIYLDKTTTYNNATFGIVLALSLLPGPNAQQVNITINNYVDEYSYIGFAYAGFKNNYSGNVLNGNVRIVNPVWKNNVKALGYVNTTLNSGTYRLGPTIEFKHVSIIKNDSNVTSGKDVPLNKIGEYFMKLNQSNQNKLIID